MYLLALRPALTALLTKHMSAYQKWQENEDMHIFFSSFLNTLKLAHESGTLTSALTLAQRWYLSQKYPPRQLLIFLGFPFVKADKEYETGINQLRPDNANLALDIIDSIEKRGLWPKDISAMHFLKWMVNAPICYLLLSKQRFEEQLAFQHKENNYSALFRAFWTVLGNAAQHNELGTYREVALAPTSCPAPPEDDIESE